MRSASLERGFTILEILIAIVILVVGIVGIIALFPTAIESGNKTVEDSYAASITQSVMDAVSVGVRESRFSTTGSSSVVYTFFIFQHDGVRDLENIPNDPSAFSTVANRDFCIVLPARANQAGSRNVTNANGDNEPTYVYPRPDPNDNTNAVQGQGDDGENFTDERREQYDGVTDREVRRVYHLGRKPNYTDPLDRAFIRDEFLGEAAGGGTDASQRPIVDPYPQYSFAFQIRRAKTDSNRSGAIDAADNFSSSLFEVRIMIFRNYDDGRVSEAITPRTNVPIHEFITLISI